MAKRRGTAILIHLDKADLKRLDAHMQEVNAAVKRAGGKPNMTRTSTAEVLLKDVLAEGKLP